MYLIALNIILIIIVSYLLFTRYDHRKRLCGIWSATSKFCDSSGISSFVIKFDKDLSSGNVVIIAQDGKQILCNTIFHITNWSILPPNTPNFIEKLKFKYNDKSPLPTSVILEHKEDILSIKSVTKLYGEFVKIASL